MIDTAQATLLAKAKAARILRVAERHELTLTPAEHTALFAICVTPIGRQLRAADLAALASLSTRTEIAALTADCEPLAPIATSDDNAASEPYVSVLALPAPRPLCPASASMLVDAERNSREFGHVGRDGRMSNFGTLPNGRCARLTPRQHAIAAEARRIESTADREGVTC